MPSLAIQDPFNKPSADIILRSSDDVEFHVHKAVLVLNSPLFETMFDLPQSPINNTSEIEPIPMTESSRVLNILLRMCYPLVDRVPDGLTLEDTRAVLEAAIKYDMPTPIELMRRSLLDYASKESLRVYAIACILNLAQEARRAADVHDPLGDHDVEELEELPAGYYHRLLQFHERITGAEDFSFLPAASDTLHVDGMHEVMSGPSQHPWCDAGSPFDRLDSNTIVVSRDQVRFRIHSEVLKFISPAFEDMLKNKKPYPREEFEQDAKLQSVQYYIVLPEFGEVLEALFRLCFPPNALDIFESVKNYTMLRAITTAAIKYAMHGVVRLLKNYHLTHLEPFQAWLSTILYGWTDEAKNAAERTLEISTTDLRALYYPDLEHIPSGHYFRLLQYHEECGMAASDAVEFYNFLPQAPSIVFGSVVQSYCVSCQQYLSTAEFREWMEAVCSSIHEKPHVSVLSEVLPINHPCPETFKSALVVVIKGAISEVEYRLTP